MEIPPAIAAIRQQMLYVARLSQGNTFDLAVLRARIEQWTEDLQALQQQQLPDPLAQEVLHSVVELQLLTQQSNDLPFHRLQERLIQAAERL